MVRKLAPLWTARRLLLVDVGLVLVLSGLTEWAVWGGDGVVGTAVAGPRWFTAALPLLLNVPLLARRRHPLIAWTVMIAGVVVQAVSSGNSAEGFELLLPLAIGAYAVGRFGVRREALLGLLVFTAGYLPYSLEDANVRSGDVQQAWAAAFFYLAVVLCGLVGVFLRSRHEAAVLAAHAAAVEREAQAAVAEERARMARELHDIVSHNLSVVVVQAAGGRATPGRTADETAQTLEKIEGSGREALVEMRRLLGVLRDRDGEPELGPQPGIERLAALIDSVRAAGLPVECAIDVGRDVPPAVGLSAYRVVQEALTNVLKHAGSASARVCVRREDDAVVVEVADDGAGVTGPGSARPGHGLVGMRERVALLGGDLRAAPRPEGGFAIHARLPLAGAPR
jgi:signal transduction histidine kinase